MSDIDTKDWLSVGLSEVDGAETLEEARDEARGLVLMAAARLVEAVEIHLLTRPWRETMEGHPLSERLLSYRIARAKLDDVYADMRQTAAPSPVPTMRDHE